MIRSTWAEPEMRTLAGQHLRAPARELLMTEPIATRPSSAQALGFRAGEDLPARQTTEENARSRRAFASVTACTSRDATQPAARWKRSGPASCADRPGNRHRRGTAIILGACRAPTSAWNHDHPRGVSGANDRGRIRAAQP